MATLVKTENSLIVSDARNISALSYNSIVNSRPSLSNGQGIFAGKLPDYFARLADGLPATNLVIELYMEGYKVAETTTDVNGAWFFENLDHTKMYDIIAKHPTLEAIISSKRYPKLRLDSIQTNTTKTSGDFFTRRFIVKGGVPPYAVDVITYPVTYTINQDLGIIELTAEKIATEEIYPIIFSCQDNTNIVIQNFVVPAL